MFARRLLAAVILVLGTLCSASSVLAADILTPADSAGFPSCILVTPEAPAQGITASQFLLNQASDVPGAWISAGPESGEHISVETVLCTGMQLHYVIDRGEWQQAAIAVWGDVLGQGRLTLSQLVRLAQLIAAPEGIEACVLAAADVNGDGQISLSDLCTVVRSLPAEQLPPTAEKVMEDMQATDILNYIPTSLYLTSESQKWYKPVLSNRQLTLELPERYRAWLNDAASHLHFASVARVETNFEVPSWALLASIAANCKTDPESMRNALLSAVRISASSRQEEEGTVLSISAQPVDAAELFYGLPQSPATNAFSLSTSYAYLSTVFDDAMNERRGIGEPELEAMLFPIAYPSRYYVGDCWYQPRDQGARKHTGTDINAPRGTNLLACVNGVIIRNGWDPVAGNYIVLRGADGTQYHYYHMVQLSDVPVGTQVRRGEVMGHVGSTGNSRANHLHMAIITAGGQYVNPVRYLQRAQRATVNGTITGA